MTYRIEIVRAARKQMLALPRPAQLAIAKAIDRLASIPRPPKCKKLRGAELWRLKLERYRVVYTVDDKSRLVTIVKVAVRREDTYQGL